MHGVLHPFAYTHAVIFMSPPSPWPSGNPGSDPDGAQELDGVSDEDNSSKYHIQHIFLQLHHNTLLAMVDSIRVLWNFKTFSENFRLFSENLRLFSESFSLLNILTYFIILILFCSTSSDLKFFSCAITLLTHLSVCISTYFYSLWCLAQSSS